MKKIGLHILGAILLSSLSVKAALPIKKRKSFECYSDSKIVGQAKKRSTSIVNEYSALVEDFDGYQATFTAKKHYLLNGEIRLETLTIEKAYVESTSKYLTIQGKEWALAIAPEKKRASLYSMNPEINEVPMFCLSQQ